METFKIGGTYRTECDTIEPFLIGKGGGSAYGGKWKPDPSKPYDGRAGKERHYTDHKQPWAHTNPHDHVISWDDPTGHPHPGAAINYPNGAPEFKQWQEVYDLTKYTISPDNTPEQDRFVSISDFKDCMRWGGEVEFTWNGDIYSITHRSNGKISISMAYREDTEKLCDTADEALEYMVGADRLRDVIKQVTVLDRTI